ncbi:MAG: hypothetical protein M3Z13_01915 [Candidatus Dormibacteraeota bacterium]|nr:hypothetical protein [Candidatus Dormibacteraeota bacterium]
MKPKPHRVPLNPEDRRRRNLLDESDELLEEVEELRLEEERAVPENLRRAIEALQVKAGRGEASIAPASLRNAHELVLSVQYRLMSGNPRNRSTGTHLGRGAGQASTLALAAGGSWKQLVLPPPAEEPALWQGLVGATLERALDRWMYAQHHAAQAARDRSGARQALARARTAWMNYWELREEADRLLGSPAQVAGQLAGQAGG